MNYPLTEFSLKELNILSNLIGSKIEEKQYNIHAANMMVSRTFKGKLLDRYNEGLPELREMHVRVLTAIDIVKQRETTNAN